MTTTEAQRSGAPARVLSDVNRSLTTSSFHDLNNSGAQPVIAQYSTTSSVGGMPSIVVVSLDRIFEGFFTTKEEGIGIGLAICQSILLAHGGAIAASNLPEGGACFRLSLPAGGVL